MHGCRDRVERWDLNERVRVLNKNVCTRKFVTDIADAPSGKNCALNICKHVTHSPSGPFTRVADASKV